MARPRFRYRLSCLVVCASSISTPAIVAICLPVEHLLQKAEEMTFPMFVSAGRTPPAGLEAASSRSAPRSPSSGSCRHTGPSPTSAYQRPRHRSATEIACRQRPAPERSSARCRPAFCPNSRSPWRRRPSRAQTCGLHPSSTCARGRWWPRPAATPGISRLRRGISCFAGWRGQADRGPDAGRTGRGGEAAPRPAAVLFWWTGVRPKGHTGLEKDWAAILGRLGLIQGRDGGARQPAERRAALL